MRRGNFNDVVEFLNFLILKHNKPPVHDPYPKKNQYGHTYKMNLFDVRILTNEMAVPVVRSNTVFIIPPRKEEFRPIIIETDFTGIKRPLYNYDCFILDYNNTDIYFEEDNPLYEMIFDSYKEIKYNSINRNEVFYIEPNFEDVIEKEFGLEYFDWHDRKRGGSPIPNPRRAMEYNFNMGAFYTGNTSNIVSTHNIMSSTVSTSSSRIQAEDNFFEGMLAVGAVASMMSDNSIDNQSQDCYSNSSYDSYSSDSSSDYSGSDD